MECDSNVGCVTERDCHQTARCTAETAEHFESRRSAERSRSRRRRSCEKAEQTAARLTAERCRSQLRRNAETPEQSAARRSSQRDCRQRQRQQLKSAVPLSRRPKSSQNRALLFLIIPMHMLDSQS